MNKNILILLMLGITLTISAKPGKIKYGKFLIYEGEVVDKQPSGAGTLKAIEPKNKKEYAFTIEGVFNGSAVTNPHIKSQNGMPEMNVEGVVVVETKGDKGKVEALNLLLKHVKITDFAKNEKAESLGTEFYIEELALNQRVVNGEKWEFSYGGGENGTKVSDTSIEKELLSGVIKEMGRGLDMEEQKVYETLKKTGRLAALREVIRQQQMLQQPVKLFCVNKAPQTTPSLLSKLGYRPYKEYFALHISDGKFVVASSWYTLNEQGTFLYADDSFVNMQADSEFSSDGKSWKGKRSLDDGTVITKSKGESVAIAYVNGNKFIGTIKGGSLQLAKADCNIAGVKYQEGYLYKNGKEATRYLLGEPYDSLHNRLKSELCDSLIEKVENGGITEAKAVALQKQIEKERQEALQRQTELRKMMNSHWGADGVMFSGDIISTTDGAKAWREIFGINPSYITGEAILAFDCLGEAAFVFAPVPSELSYNEGRGRLLQVNGFCQRLANVIEKDKYRIENHTLYIGEKEIGTFSADWKTFTHTEQGMLKTTMKVTKREKISEDGSKHTNIQ